MTNTERATLPTIFVVFGITGDLAHRKLIPALFHLYRKKLLPSLFQVVGFSRQELTNEEVQQKVRDIIGVPPDDERELVEKFSKLFVYKQGLFEDRAGYEQLAEYLGQKDGAWRVCSNKLFYLAVPPQYYEEILRNLDRTKLTEPCGPEEGWTRVIVEKPFGKDLETAEALDLLLGRLFAEEQIYRIDHYLGKETVQNILAFRFSNSFLAPAWDRKHIEQVTIRAWERTGVEKRGEFYDGIGALRDFGQNHLLQLLALIAMEKPATFDTAAIRAGRLATLRTLRPMTPSDIKKQTMRGQYEGYREAKGVDPASQTETYFRLTAFLRSARWRGVPFILESGKKMKRNIAEVEIRFRHESPCLCPGTEAHYQNILRYEFQPNEKITLSFWVKRPGATMVVEEKDFLFDYHAAFDTELFLDPYEKLLLDTVLGNQTLFVSTDEIKASWRYIDPVIRAWQKGRVPLRTYPPGEFVGPKEETS